MVSDDNRRWIKQQLDARAAARTAAHQARRRRNQKLRAELLRRRTAAKTALHYERIRAAWRARQAEETHDDR